MEVDNKRICQYGAKCYRKNKNHLKEFYHPPSVSSDNDNEDVASNGCEKKGKSREKAGGLVRKCPPESPVRKKRKSSESGKESACKNGKAMVQSRLKFSGEEQEGIESSSGNTKEKCNEERSKKENEEKNCEKDDDGAGDGDGSDGECENDDVKSNSWTYIKPPTKTEVQEVSEFETEEWKQMSKEDKIKNLFLVNMPPDFYSFFEFCNSVNDTKPIEALNDFRLRLVGPYDILAGSDMKLTNREEALCRWRYFYDPPEFQTVLASKSGFHVGYWRDSPEEMPVFLASNNPNEDCTFKIEGENIFAAVHHYLAAFIKTSEPFTKVKASKFQSRLSEWAEKSKLPMEKMTQAVKSRARKVNSKTFHRAGIVVPVERKTEVGYRPLIETEANIKKICNLIMDASSDDERDILMDKLHPLITAANIANDECDFGNGLELGIDLFCMGSPVFHDMVLHLLTTSYSLLNRSQFGDIIKAHLKNRRKTIEFATS